MFIFLIDKKNFKEKRKEYRSHERKYENNPEATNTTSEDHVPSSASSSSSYRSKKLGNSFKTSHYSKPL